MLRYSGTAVRGLLALRYTLGAHEGLLASSTVASLHNVAVAAFHAAVGGEQSGTFASKRYFRQFQGSSLSQAPKTTKAAVSQSKSTTKAKSKTQTKTKAKTKEPPKPSYHTFMSQEWHSYKVEGDSIGDTVKKMAAKWKEMSLKEKAKYEQKIRKAKKQPSTYANFVKQEYSKYRQSKDDTLGIVNSRLSAAWKVMSEAEKSKYRIERVAKAKRPITSGYTYFVKDRMGEPRPVGEKVTDAIKRIATEWKALKDEQRKQWNDRVANNKVGSNAGK